MTQPRRYLLLALGLAGLLVAFTAGGFAWYFYSNPCEAEAVQEASIMLSTQAGRFDDVYASATSGTRTSLGYPVATLQQILTDTQGLPVPGCMQSAQDELVEYMRTVIRAFRAYEAGETDAAVRSLIVQSGSHYSNYLAELAEVRQCAPYCLP